MLVEILDKMRDDNLSLDLLPFSSIKEIDLVRFEGLIVDYVETEPSIKLRVIRLKSSFPLKISTVVLTGLSSHFLGWIATDYELAKIGNVFHIDSREKHDKIRLSLRLKG
ncbi:MAG: hypothetical protein ACTSYD_12040 [Candidatus Heimdallarchaeaceae archaeon]